ncbi:MAG: GTP-binding protein [Ichthyobacteriaceae bacterium]|nr:GTP-binding protein [Ichthyobacteriaceae bacterium]
MIPFYIITGWLGSGKTTLLKKILHEFGNGNKIAVIQNEFAPSGVDGIDLKNSSPEFKLMEINNGSVFCVCQLDNFMGVLEKLAADYKPDAIFLESSGLADPISIAQILQSPKISDKVSLQNIYTLVDAVNFKQTFRIMTRFKHQVMVADKLIINKIDLVDDVEELQNQLKEWNPFAEQKLTTHCDIKFDYFFDQPETNTYKSVPLVGGGNKPNMGLSLLRIHEEITEERLNTFIQKISASSYRIKGFVNLVDGRTVAVQGVYEKYDIQEIGNYEGRTELIIFNDKYSNSELREMFTNKKEEFLFI